jgi:glycosyltransferase involved in cell wall biosynthesis
MGPSLGVLQVLRAVSILSEIKRVRFFGEMRPPSFLDDLMESARSLRIAEKVSYEGFVLAPLDVVIRRTMESSAGLVLYQAATINERHMGSATNKLFEYAARGIPVVVPDRQSFRDFLAGEEWVECADPGSGESIAKALMRIFTDPNEYAAKCRAARRAFEEKYNYERVFAPVVHRLRQLAASR